MPFLSKSRKLFVLLSLTLGLAGAHGESQAGENPGAGRERTETPIPLPPEGDTGEQNEPAVPTLPPIAVVDSAIPPDPAQASLGAQTIDRLPAGDGSLNELLRVLPGIQTAEGFRSSNRGGEILPPPVSISGGKVYENTFLIDGFGNDSLLDPTFDNPSNTDNVPGHPQAVFLDPELLEGVNVLRSNISARYGRFAGGVVDARTRAPAATVGFKTAYRTTRSEWTRFHIADDGEEAFAHSSSETNQPRFRKHDGRLTLDLPLTDRVGLLAHYSLLYAKIPLDHLGASEVQTRSLETVFLKALVRPTATVDWASEIIWSPYEGKYFLKDTRESEFTLEGGGYAFNSRLDLHLPPGLLELAGGYRKSVNSRRAPRDYFIWRHSPSAAWGALAGDEKFSREGAFGDVDKEQETVSFAAHFTAEPLHTGGLAHVLAGGVQYERARARFDRSETATRYTNASLNDQVVCAPGDLSCVAGEQFMIYKVVNATDAADAAVTFTDLYLEDVMTLGRFSLRPGVRLSHDDLLENTDLAPRLSAAFDLFGNGRTVLTAGVNRYYGKTLLTHALAAEKVPYTVWTRPAALGADGMPQPWTERPRTAISATRLADLDTPYADEVTAGVAQRLLGGELALLFIDRRGRDELTVRTFDKDANGYVYTEWTNEGKSDHREYSLAWERHWRRHYLLLNVTWQESETSHLDYDERFEGDDLEDPVWHDGRLVELSELPAADYNREWKGNLVYSATLPRGFSFTNVTRYRSGYRALADSGDDTTLADGRVVDVYREVKHPEAWVFDWKLAWQRPVAPGRLSLTLEVENVFNEKVRTGVGSEAYELGRQFWAEVAWAF